jgi:hypothetical protein
MVRESGLESYLADRYAIVGTPEDCLATIQRMRSQGVNKIWLNVHFDDKLAFIKRWGSDVLAKLS